VGTTLRQKWHLDRLLGIGGMAAVYAASHRNGSRGAIKMLHAEMSLDAEIRRRFLREGYVANAVDHPGTVKVLDDEVAEDGSVFIVMELLEGETLDASAERRGGRLPAGELLPIVDQLLDILVAAHARGVVHRDIKPENVFITRTGQVKLLDFGVARLRLHQGSMATVTGSTFGTPAFMAPEQALGRNQEVDARSDLWSVGATLFMLLSGRCVHVTQTLNEQLVAHASIPAPSLTSVATGVDPTLIALVDRALAYQKEARFQTAAAMQEALRRVLMGMSHQAAPTVPVTALPQASGAAQVPRAPVLPSVAGVTAIAATAPPTTPSRSNVLIGAALGMAVVLAGVLAVNRAVHGGSAAPAVEGPMAPAMAEPSASAEAGRSKPAATTETLTVEPSVPAPSVEPAASASASASASAKAQTPPVETSKSPEAAKPPETAKPASPMGETPKPPAKPTGDAAKPPAAKPPKSGGDWLDRQH
jgi:serine/threonine-protein kinase